MSKLRPVLVRGTFRAIKGVRRKLPLIAGHKLLYSCNLRCRMCPFWRRSDERLLTLSEEVKMMDKLAEAGVLFMGFEGGEPTLRRDLPDILRESHERFHTSLVTNGFTLSNKVEQIHRYLDYLFVSLDGIGATHDKIRGVEGSFQRAVEGIKKAREYIPVGISSTLTEENLDEAVPLVELADRLGVSINFQVAFNYSTAEKLTPSRAKLRGVLETLLKLKGEGYPIINSKEYFEALLSSWYGGVPWECKPWLTINIDPQGRIVLPCYVLEEYRGGVKVWETNIVELWNSYDWENLKRCNKCALSCYLEPSLFSWSNPSMVKERLLDNIVSVIRKTVSRGTPRKRSRPTGQRLPLSA